MKTALKIIIALVFVSQAQAQEIPQVKLGDSTFLDLTALSVKTEIVGNIATTSYSMTFYNATDRVLEGELAFPLGQGQSITNFAMDVNGKMRDAVIVEKELGRVAYESTVRQTIDPGLLEVTKGNNYKARVYPIPAKGFKHLKITFEQELKANNGKHIYKVPFNFTKPIDFSFQVLLYNSNLAPKVIEGKKYGLKFKENSNGISAVTNKKAFIANEIFKFELPILKNETVSTYYNYFNIYKSFEPKTRLKIKPKTVTILWDASYSMEYRKLDQELKLLGEYFKYLNNVSVDFITINNSVSQTKSYNIQNGNWKRLKNEIKSIVYDGGTSYLDIKKIKTDEILFFTDGMFNLGGLETTYKGIVYTINAVKSANHIFLENVATDFGGKYINLNQIDYKDGFNFLKTEAFKFLGVNNNNDLTEVYPEKGITVYSDFSISGKFKKDTDIELLFGYGNEVTEKIKLNLKSSSFNKLIKRLWAKKKLTHLNKEKEINKNEIISLAKKNHLITEFTSMIILDRIEDYVRYNIKPPKELKSQFKDLIASRQYDEEDRLEDIKDRKEELFEDYKDLKDWYNTKYPIVKKKVVVIPQPVENNTTTEQHVETTNATIPENNQPEPQVINENVVSVNTPRPLGPNEKTISGVILDESGLPLPSATVIVEGTTNGTSTDFDGNFSINVQEGDIIEVNYIGYNNKTVTVGVSNTINVSLESDNNLEEVVIVGYAIQKKEMLTSSVTQVTSESVSEVVNNLSGKVAGVNIANGFSPNTVAIRGVSSINNTAPLYVIDGIPYTDEEYNTIETDKIASIQVLKDANGSALYGSRGTNGVIIITTKEGLEKNSQEIEEFNKKVNEDTQFKPWTPNADYLKIISSQNSIDDAYTKYLELRIKYRNTPTFFIDVADFFDSKLEKAIAIKILTNLAEIDLDNHEVMRALAYKLEYFKKDDLALHVYKEVLKIRPEEPQSTRDLALAHENVGNYQQAFNLLYKIVNGELVEKDLDERFYGIEHLAFIEASHILKKHKTKIKLTKEQVKLIKPLTIDLRIIVDWNHNDTDLDLWVENPKKEAVSYKNTTTDLGDRISEDMTEGYGPEEFMIKKAIKGEYEIELDYFSDSVQKISGPTVLKITIFKNYGKKNETKEIRILRLDQEEDDIEVGTINFK